MLQHVGSNLRTVKFFVQHFECCTRLATFTQHCWTRACALGLLVACQGPGTRKHPHVALKMLKMLRAFGQPVKRMSQHHATMLYDVALKCCERLARPLQKNIQKNTILYSRDKKLKLQKYLLKGDIYRSTLCSRFPEIKMKR